MRLSSSKDSGREAGSLPEGAPGESSWDPSARGWIAPDHLEGTLKSLKNPVKNRVLATRGSDYVLRLGPTSHFFAYKIVQTPCKIQGFGNMSLLQRDQKHTVFVFCLKTCFSKILHFIW